MFEKKRGTRFLASVMALVMLLSLAPVGALATEGEEQPAENQAVAQPADETNPKPTVTGGEDTTNTNEEPTPPPANEGIATLPANNNNAPVALPETPVIVKPTEVLDQAVGVDSDTSKDNGIAEYGSYDYKARTVKVAVYATDGSSAGSKVNTDIAKLLGIPCKQNDGYYPIGVIEIDKNLVTGQTPYINTEKDWEEVKAAIEKIDTEDLTNNTVKNVNNVAGSENKENTIAKNLDKVQVDLNHEAGSHKTALFTWKGDSQNIRGNYKYHLDLRFATVTLTFTGVKENGETVDMGSRIYLKDTEILKPGTSDDFYLENIPEDYQIAGYYTTYSLNEEYTFGQAADKDTTIYVKLEEKPVQITYDLNGGNLNGDIQPVVYNDLKVGDNMRTPSDPKREGYTFKGWKDKDGKSPSQQVTGDATYFAQWEKIPDPEPVQSTDVYVYFRVVNTNDENVSIDGLSVKYNANAGGNTWCTFGKISTTEELTLNNVKKDAETQLTSTNAQIHTDNAGIKDKVLSNVTWYQLGTWAGAPGYYDSGTYWHLDGKITGYTVTYNNGTTEATDAVHNMPDADEMYYLRGSEYTVSNATPTRDGYVFTGWKSDNDNKVYDSESKMIMPAKNVVLTAQWEKDELVDPSVDKPEGITKGDGIADKYQIQVSFEAMNGTFKDGENSITEYTTVVTKYTSGEPSENGTAKLANQHLKAEKPDAGFTEPGSWKKGTDACEKPKADDSVQNGDHFVVTFEQEKESVADPIHYTINQHFIDAQKADKIKSTPKQATEVKTFGDSIPEEMLAVKQDFGDPKQNYVYVPAETTYKVGNQKKETTDNLANGAVIDLYYYLDVIGGKDEKGNLIDKGDEIPDCYQVTIIYKSSDESRGKISDASPKKEVLTITDKDGNRLSSGKVEITGASAEVTGSSCYFSNWTNKDNAQVDTKATLEARTIDAKGGDVYTFTANFDRSSGGGGGGSNRPKPPVVEIPDDVPTGLNGKDHYAYIIGYGNNDVRPQNNITRAEVATIFFRLLTDETRTANMTKSNGYNDMKDGDWFCCAVSTLSKMGIIKGYEDGSFKPNDPISRAEFAAIAARFDPDGDKTPATFADVTSHWAKDEISIAANHGWIKGYEDGSFKPDQKITRAETMTLVNRVLNRLPEAKDDLHKDMKTWVDNMDETAWYYLAVQEATNSHYFKNKTSTKFEQWTDLRDTRDWSELEK